MRNKHFVLVPAFMLVFVFSWAAGARAFDCGGKFISEGMFRDEVLQRCGSPSSSDSWQEERLIDGRPFVRDYWPRDRYPRTIRVTVDRWTYNPGPSKFMRILTFENGKLISIKSGDVGY